MRKAGSCALLDEQLQGGERKKQSTEPKILAFQTTTSYLVKEAVLLSIRTHSSLLRVRVKPRIPESHALFADPDKVLDLIKRKDLAFTPTSG